MVDPDELVAFLLGRSRDVQQGAVARHGEIGGASRLRDHTLEDVHRVAGHRQTVEAKRCGTQCAVDRVDHMASGDVLNAELLL